MTSQSKSPHAAPKQAGARIPDKPRDCGPHVDTWPILDAEAGAAPKDRKQKPQRDPRS